MYQIKVHQLYNMEKLLKPKPNATAHLDDGDDDHDEDGDNDNDDNDENTDKSDSAEYCCSYSDGHPLAMLQQFQALEAASDVYMPLCQPPKPQNLQMPRDKTMRLRVQEGDNFGRTIIMSEE